MNHLRAAIIIVGILLPYLARIPGGTEWVEQYMWLDLGGFLFTAAFNAIAWGALLALTFLYRHAASMFFPCGLGFVFLAWAHYTLDLAADAQASIALIFIPIYSLVPTGVGALIGLVIDRRVRRADPDQAP